VEHPTRWLRDASGNFVNVHCSCPLVADLIPGDNGAKEIAVIVYQRLSGGSWYSDGKIYIWRADGTLAWTSKKLDGTTDLQIDTNGDNTLSAADIDNKAGAGNAHLELIAPSLFTVSVGGKNRGQMFAFGYDSNSQTFRSLAGWPALTYGYEFKQISAAIGDANLDGTLKTVAADYCCYTYSWNPTGNWNPLVNWTPSVDVSYLWEQVTGSTGTSVIGSSVALGDVDSTTNPSGIPDAVVGSHYSGTPVFAFCGNHWGTTPNEYPTGWSNGSTTNVTESSPAIGFIDGDQKNDVAICDDDGKLYLWLSSTSAWSSHQLASTSDSDKKIKSSPVIAELGGQKCVVVGCNNGRVYAVKSDWTPITGWPSDGICPSWRSGFKIIASPVIADVMNTGSPQIVVACTDGNVYALWPDGNNHAGGPVAKVWVCAQSAGVEVDSTPTVCSLDGTQVCMIVGSTDGIYKVDLYSLQQGESFVPNSARWPWPTFHRDNARTGCNTAPANPVCASIMGTVTLNGAALPLAKISIKTLGGQNVPVQGQSSATRIDPVRSVGDLTANNEVDEGAYCINQLPPNATYRITASDANGQHQTTLDAAVTTGCTHVDISLPQ